MDIINTNLPYEGYCVSLQGGRPENQDTIGYCDTPYGLLVVLCDGMGGGPGGKTASTLAVESILNFVLHYEDPKDVSAPKERTDILKDAIADAEKNIIEFQNEHADYAGMGTTVAALLINSYSAIVAHVGDSRCYLLRRGNKKFRTEDHSFVADLVRQSRLTEEQARLSSQSNIITRALSGHSNGEPSICELAYEKGDRFVLCTDGIWGMMPEAELIKYLTRGKNYPLIVEKLALDVDAIGRKSGGGHDNLTLSLVVTKNDSELKEPMSRKYRYILLSLIAVCIISIIVICIQLFIINKQDNAINNKDEAIDKYKKNEKVLKQDSDEKDKQIKDLKEIQEDCQETIDTYKKQDQERKAKAEKEKKEKEQKKATQQKEQNKTYNNNIKILKSVKESLSKIHDLKTTDEKKKRVNVLQGELRKVVKHIKNAALKTKIEKEIINEMGKSCTLEPKSGQDKYLIRKLNDLINELKVEDFL